MAKQSKHTYRLPAEWEKHEATILCWPTNTTDWPGKFVPIHWVYSEIVKKIAESEKVILLAQNSKQREFIKRVLEKAHANIANVDLSLLATDRSWMRDSAPVFVLEGAGKKAIRKDIHFKFNGWAKYPNWKKDFKLPSFIAKVTGDELITAEFQSRHVVLEGGSIDYNGQGTLLTTEECLLDPKIQVRNPGFSKSDYENLFKQYMGIDKVIWLGDGIAGDDTHGHVDDLCRFVNPHTVVLVSETDSTDANYHKLMENKERLEGMTTARGEKIDVIPLPMPKALVFENMRLPASYANFYITNQYVLVPTFNDPMDKIALGTLQELFPEHLVTGIHSTDLVWGLGTLHCLSHELPAIQ